jgi:small nuclear ribonucleoprotein G
MKTEKPELGKYMDKRLAVALNGGRAVEGVLRGYDQFLNLVLDQAVDVKGKAEIGMVVIRGNSVSTLEALEPIA